MSTFTRIARRTTPAALVAFSVALTATAMTLALSPSNAQTPGTPGPAIALEQHGPTLPALTGTAAVGRVEIALTDLARTDPFADDGRPRELAVWIWYPTNDETAPRADYLPPAWAALANNVGPLMQDLMAVSPHAYAGAALDGRPPVVVLLPGLGQPVASYTALAEDLASHGYAIIGINPTGSTDMMFPDGHVVMATAAGGIDPALLADVPAWYAAAEVITDVWADDAAFVVAALATASPDIGELDFGRVAYVGHSLGGAAAFEACSRSVSCAGAVDLDGTLWTEIRHTGLEAPNLILRRAPEATCDLFCQPATADFAVVLAAGNSVQFSVAGTLHMSFTDLGLLPSPGNNEAYRGTLDPERLIAITRDLVRSFLDQHVRELPGEDLAAVAGRYPELTRP